MKVTATGEYWQIMEGRKYWNVWMGNPFCLSLQKIPKSEPIEKIKQWCIKSAKKEKARFTKKFPDVKWRP